MYHVLTVAIGRTVVSPSIHSPKLHSRVNYPHQSQILIAAQSSTVGACSLAYVYADTLQKTLTRGGSELKLVQLVRRLARVISTLVCVSPEHNNILEESPKYDCIPTTFLP